MPVGNIKLKGNLGTTAPYGKMLPSTLGAAALRSAAKAGLGAETTGQPNPVKPGQSKEIFGIPMGQPSVPAKKKAKSLMHPRSGDVLEGGNIDLYNRPKVKNKDKSISTVNSMSFRNNKNQEVLIPGVERTGKGLLHQKKAQEQYGRTGEHLGKFKTVAAADKYAERLHKNQEKAYITRPRQKTARKK